MTQNKNINYYNSLDFFKDSKNKNEKLKLTKNNANFIEATLKIDSRYKDSSDPDKKPSKEYINILKEGNIDNHDNKIKQYGSGQFWIRKLVEIIDSNNIDKIIEDNFEYEKKSSKTRENDVKDYSLDLKTVIKGAVCAVDRENATHLTAHISKEKVGRSNVSTKIYNEMQKGLGKFKTKLTEPNDFSIITKITIPVNNDKENYHYSFATKFCKYLSLGFDIDKYYIYDSIVISNINYYIEKYGLDKNIYSKNTIKFDKCQENLITEKYMKLWNCLEEIRTRANKDENEEIKRYEIDHMIWYSNK